LNGKLFQSRRVFADSSLSAKVKPNGEIKSVVRGPFASLGEKLALLFQKQGERDKTLAELYAHKYKVHSQRRHSTE
jgi:hypothetical protein